MVIMCLYFSSIFYCLSCNSSFQISGYVSEVHTHKQSLGSPLNPIYAMEYTNPTLRILLYSTLLSDPINLLPTFYLLPITASPTHFSPTNPLFVVASVSWSLQMLFFLPLLLSPQRSAWLIPLKPLCRCHLLRNTFPSHLTPTPIHVLFFFTALLTFYHIMHFTQVCKFLQ